jgi:hypothetical protein
MKFLVPNYSCLQNPWLWGCRPQIPVLSVLCPQLNLLTTPRKKFLATPLYLTTHKTLNRQTPMPPVGFEPTTPAGEGPQTYARPRGQRDRPIYTLHFINKPAINYLLFFFLNRILCIFTSASNATGDRAKDWGSFLEIGWHSARNAYESRELNSSRTALGPAQLPVQWVSGHSQGKAAWACLYPPTSIQRWG